MYKVEQLEQLTYSTFNQTAMMIELLNRIEPYLSEINYLKMQIEAAHNSLCNIVSLKDEIESFIDTNELSSISDVNNEC